MGVVNGNQCVDIPLDVRACDHVFDVAQPVQSWGNEVGVANVENRPLGSIYRIVAAYDDTELYLDGEFLQLLNKGDVYETEVLPGNHNFRGSRPIMVAQFITSQFSEGASVGDPSFGTMIPFSQYTTEYAFVALPQDQFPVSYATIIAKSMDVTEGNVLLDGFPVDSGTFTPVPDSDYLAAVILISEGSHTTTSIEPHGITVHGYSEFDSYLYPGIFVNNIVDENLPIIEIKSVDPPVAEGTVRDSRSSEDANSNGFLDDGEDLNTNGLVDQDKGVFEVGLEDEQNLALTFLGDLPASSVSFTVELIDADQPGSGTIVAVDGAGNEARQFVEIDPTPTGKGKGGKMMMMMMMKKKNSMSSKSSMRSKSGAGKGKGKGMAMSKSMSKSVGKGIQYIMVGTSKQNQSVTRSRTRARAKGNSNDSKSAPRSSGKAVPYTSRVRTRAREDTNHRHRPADKDDARAKVGKVSGKDKKVSKSANSKSDLKNKGMGRNGKVKKVPDQDYPDDKKNMMIGKKMMGPITAPTTSMTRAHRTRGMMGKSKK